MTTLKPTFSDSRRYKLNFTNNFLASHQKQAKLVQYFGSNRAHCRKIVETCPSV
jgi:hypothetical protein